VFEVAPGELGAVRELVTEQMCGAYQLSVPLDVSFGTGSNWDEAGH
jgi:DNA polymerase-1